jgi:hypothetical protein
VAFDEGLSERRPISVQEFLDDGLLENLSVETESALFGAG